MRTKLRGKVVAVGLTVFLLCAATASGTIVYLKQFNFNDDRALEAWSKMVLKGQVEYVLMKYGNNGYVEAMSDKTCSALYYRLDYKLKDYPLLSWKWRAIKFPDKTGAITEKQRDDYAARVYVIFPFLCFSSSKFIEYVWSENEPEGTVLTSPEGDNIRIIVARSGKADGEQMVVEHRNVFEDYCKAFGAEPSRDVGAVAIMCDADSTKTQAEAVFDDITIANLAGEERRIPVL